MRAPLWIGFALLAIPPVSDAHAIPAFARRHRVSCQLCHNVVPALTAFGERYAANGFRMAPGEEAPNAIATGDELLSLPGDLPLAIRLDAYVQLYAGDRAVADFQTPYGLKLLSGGPISKSFSYYVYAFLFERGEVGGVEDAFLFANDIGGQPIDLAIGQFQVSDPMFKRELRLEFEDYAVYRARVGDVPVDLTYDRGLYATADAAGFTLSAELVNGNGRGEADEERRFDGDAPKNLFVHLSRDLVEGIRLGVSGYYGRTTAETARNRTTMLGADATFARGPLELNVQVLHREDDAPTFTPGEPEVSLDGGFAELLVRPAGSRWYGFALYNHVETDRPLLDVRLGGPADVRRYRTASAGVGRLLQRNLRITFEGWYDLDREDTRWTVGFVSAF